MAGCCSDPEPEVETPCECPVAGYCNRHKVNKGGLYEHFHRFCRTSMSFFNAWEEGRGPGQVGTTMIQERGEDGQTTFRLGNLVASFIRIGSFGFVEATENCGCQSRKQWLNEFGESLRRKFTNPIPIVCGVTTARREKPTLFRTTESLRNAGFSVTVIRDEGAGAMRTWRESLGMLAAGHCHNVLLAQDDIVVSKHLAEYAARLDIPENTGCVSFYTPGGVELERGGMGLIPATGRTWGACCLMFPRAVAEKIAAHPMITRWPIDRRIDVAVGDVVREMGLKFYYHVPSLVQHVGEVSAFGDSRSMTHGRYAPGFLGEEFDAMSLLAAT